MHHVVHRFGIHLGRRGRGGGTEDQDQEVVVEEKQPERRPGTQGGKTRLGKGGAAGALLCSARRERETPD